MDIDYISEFEVDEDNILWIIMENDGRSEFQYVYRSAAGVYWHPKNNGFRFDPKGDVNYSKWFKHMLNMISGELGLDMRPSEKLIWKNVPVNVQTDLLNKWQMTGQTRQSTRYSKTESQI